MNRTKEKLWTPSFFILWQGQLVSTMGDAVYSIALGFWVLAVTGSTALMGTLMAASTLPGILISPFAGVLIDRSNKKRLFILMDMIRGVCIVLLAYAAYRRLIEVWMVFAAGILLSICGAIFSPGILATVPDLVPKSMMTNANSAFSMVSAVSNLVGYVSGGFLYQALGAPMLFLFNGISFLFSGASMPFVKIPQSTKKEKVHILEDMAYGFRYMWRQTGLRMILIIAAMANFFSNIGVILFLPLCQSTPSLGAGKYGIMVACYMAGMMAGLLVLSIVKVKPAGKFKLFVVANIIFNFCLIIAVNQPFFILMLLLIVLAGLFNSIFNVLLVSTVQASAPQDVRGKVMSFLTMTTQGFTPFAMAIGGVLGGIFPIRFVISFSFAALFLVTLPSYFMKSFKAYLTAEYQENDISETPDPVYH